MIKKYLKNVSIILLALLIFGGVALGSYTVGKKVGVERSIVITDSKQIIDADFSLFWNAIDLAKQKQVDAGGIKDEKFLYGAIKGALTAFEDPYTSFFEPSDAKKFEQDLNGSFGGIGAQIGMREEQIVVIAPLKGNPAEAAGLKPMDKILKINDTFTAGMNEEDAVKIIRGDVGTEVRLLILRNGWKDTKEFKITRAIIQVPTLDTEMKTLKSGDKVVWMKLYNFNSNVPPLFHTAALQAMTEGAKGIILDMRNNPGGFLDVSTDLAGWFLPRGSVVVKEKTRSGEEKSLFASGNAAFGDIPVVVLVNSGSASASEILAGALHDIRGAKLVGEKTFGKGSVQEIQNLQGGASMKITIAHWFTPKGTKIDKVGLSPDVEVKLTDVDVEKKTDPQLDKALEVIEKELSLIKQ
ncbi:MAG: S41 family peptidase [Candidatus Paceibacterota bacterium]|jgi:carboxyl-terminal processing protease